MRHCLVLIAIALPLCLTGCSKDPKERLQGKWGGHDVNNIEGSQKTEAIAWAQGIRFEFAKNKMTVAVPSEQPRTGDFDIEDAKGDKLTLRVAGEAGATDSVQFEFKGSKLLWDVGDGREIVMTRVD
jgi:hypothetical protein